MGRKVDPNSFSQDNIFNPDGSLQLNGSTVLSKELTMIKNKTPTVRQSDMTTPVAVLDTYEEIGRVQNVFMKLLLISTLPVTFLFGITMSWCDVKLPGRESRY